MMKRTLLCTAGLAALALPAVAHAQNDDAPEARNDNVIIVTATLREADVQDIPIAVTAVSPEQLQRQGINDIRALGDVSSSFNIQSSQTESQGTSIRLRGVGTTGNNIGLESSVGVFIDGVYQSRPGVALGDLVDVERLEVLRGPQGTLFGRNTSAGALNITTRRPDLNEFEGFANASYGNYNFVNVQGGVSVPLVQDSLAFRATGSYRYREGYLDNEFTDTESHNRDRYVVRGQMLWEPTPDISLRIIGDYQHTDENCCDAVILRETELVAAGAFAAYGLPNDGVVSSGFPALEELVASSQGFVNNIEQWGISGELKWDFGGAELTYIGAYRDFEGVSRQDDFTGLLTYSVAGATDPTAQPLVDTIQTQTHELRLQGSFFDDRIDWLIGGFYSDENIEENTSLTLGRDYQRSVGANLFPTLGLALGPNPLQAFTAFGNGGVPVDAAGATANNLYNQEGESFSVFTHNVFRLSDQISFTLGARYTDETKDGSYQQLSASNPACLAIANALVGGPGSVPIPAALAGLGGPALALTCFPFATPADTPFAAFLPLPRTFDDTFEDEELTYVVNINYEPNDDLLFYLSHSHGFKSGGFNLDSSAAVGGADPSFLSEEVDAYEFGIKSELWNGDVRANFALFYMDLSNFQVLEFTGIQFQTFNVSGAESVGAELELNAQFSDYISGNMALTVVDAKYDDECDFGGTLAAATGLCGARLTNAPVFTGLWGLTYDGPINDSGWGFLANMNVRFETERRTATNPLDGPLPVPNDIQESNVKVNARLGLTTPDERFTFEIWSTNLGDTRTRSITANTPLRGLTGFRSRIAFPEDPRFYGATIRARF